MGGMRGTLGIFVHFLHVSNESVRKNFFRGLKDKFRSMQRQVPFHASVLFL